MGPVFDYFSETGTGTFDMAMKNGDLAKSINTGCHVEDNGSSICQSDKVELEIRTMFLKDQRKYTKKRSK